MHIIQKDKITSRVKYSALLGVSVILGACNSTPQTMSLTGTPKVTNSVNKAVAKQAANKVTSKELTKAIAYWGGKFRKEPKNAQYALNYAKNLKFAGQESAALKTLIQVQPYAGNNKEVAGELGRLYLKKGQIKRAEPLLMKALDHARPDWKVLSALGTVNAQKGNMDNARTYFGQALSMKPNRPSILVNIATTYMLENKASEAESFLRRAHAIKPTMKTKRKLHQVLAAQGKSLNARPATQMARSLDPRRVSQGAPKTTASTGSVTRQNVRPLDLTKK